MGIFDFFTRKKEDKPETVNYRFEIADGVLTSYAGFDLPEITVPSGVHTIGKQAFAGIADRKGTKRHVEIKKIILPEGLTKICAEAFYHCDGLEEIQLPSTLQVIEKSAFEYCRSLREIVFPDGLTKIPPSCCDECSSLEKVVWPGALQSVGDRAFANCAIHDLALPPKQVSLGSGCFVKNPFKRLVIPEGYTEIGGFGGSRSLEEIEFPASLTKIRDSAFTGCVSLKTLHIPATVVSVGKDAFYGSGLRTVVFEGEKTKLSPGAFQNNRFLNSVTLPKGLEVLPYGTFYECGDLQQIDLPFSIKEIGYNAFRNSGIASVILPNKLRKIGLHAFSACKNLTVLSIPYSVKEVEDPLFDDRTPLKEINIPEHLSDQIEVPQNRGIKVHIMRKGGKKTAVQKPEKIITAFESGEADFDRDWSLKECSGSAADSLFDPGKEAEIIHTLLPEETEIAADAEGSGFSSVDVRLSKQSVYEQMSSLTAAQESLKSGSGSISNEEIRKGDIIRRKYQVVSAPFRGGMGSVWKVHHEAWNTDLAMKRPKPQFFEEAGPALKQSFIEECDCWIKLGLHPNIVTCYYVEEIGSVPSVFSEWMNGGSLEDRIQDGELYEGEEAGAAARILDIAIQTARGLHYAHQTAGIVHRDVKPANILLMDGWNAKVSDFGLARALTVSSASGHSPLYCSPEQKEKRTITKQSDLYSWAASVLEMYTGGVLWEAGEALSGNVQALWQNAKIPIPENMKRLLTRCLQRKPADRPRDFAEVEAELLKIYKILTGKPYFREDYGLLQGTAQTLNNRALSYFDLHKEEEAGRLFSEALRLEPNDPETVYNYSLYRWRKGELDDRSACSAAASAMQKYGDNEEYADYLRRFREETGSGMDALAVIETDMDEYARLRKILDVNDGKRSENFRYAASSEFKRYLLKDEKDKLTFTNLSADGSGQRFEKVVLSGEARKAVLLCSDGSALYVDNEKGQVVREFDLGEQNIFLEMLLNRDGTLLLTAGERVCLWDTASGKCLRVLEERGAEEMHYSIAADRAFATVVTGDILGRINVRSVKDGRLLRHIAVDGGLYVEKIAMDPYGTRITALLKEGFLKLWDAESGVCLHTYDDTFHHCESLCFTPDGERLLLLNNYSIFTSKRFDIMSLNARFDTPKAPWLLSRVRGYNYVFDKTADYLALCDQAAAQINRRDYRKALQTIQEAYALSLYGDPEKIRRINERLEGVLEKKTVRHAHERGQYQARERSIISLAAKARPLRAAAAYDLFYDADQIDLSRMQVCGRIRSRIRPGDEGDQITLVDYMKDGKELLVNYHYSRELRILNAETMLVKKKLACEEYGSLVTARADEKGNRILAVYREAIALWDAVSGKVLKSSKIHVTDTSPRGVIAEDLSAAVIKDGNLIQCYRILANAGPKETLASFAKTLPSFGTTSMAAISLAANEIAVYCRIAEFGSLRAENSVTFFDLRTLSAVETISDDRMRSCVYGKNGRFLYSIGSDSRIHVWNAQDHTHLYALPMETGEILRIAVTGDDKYVIAYVMRRDTDPVACVELWELEYEYSMAKG